ncbi:MAG: DUF3795 domain-containing protein [Candidatus Thorarchaeota archaeon]
MDLRILIRAGPTKNALSKDIILKFLYVSFLMRGYRIDTKGNPWWGSCKLFECAGTKGVNHCGVCSEFPCDIQVGHFDPSNPKGQQNAIMRTGVLAYWAKHGEDKAIELVKRVHGL